MAVAIGVVAAGCGSPAPASQPVAHRIVSLVPSVTDLIIALGVHDRLVARTRYDTIPALTYLPAIGGTLDPSIEKLVDLAPDLVITGFPNQDGDVSGNLARTGVRTLRVHAETLVDVWETLAVVGDRLGIRHRTDSLVSAIQDSLDAVRMTAAHDRVPSVLFLTWVSPPMTIGPRTFVHELIDAAGGRNVFADVHSNWPTVSIEAVLQRDPDVIVLPVAAGDSVALAELRRTPGFQNLRAVRQGHVLLVDRDLFSRPGPRMHEAARELSNYLSGLKGPISKGEFRDDWR
jgi:iron complex transport system substrate-binding protein